MGKTLFVVICLLLTSQVFAGELYTCIDRDGNSVITSNPQDGMKKCVLKDSYEDPTPQERAAMAKDRKMQAAQYEAESNRSAREQAARARERNEQETRELRQKRMDQTDKIRKEYWDEVDRCRGGKCRVSKDLRDEYEKAISGDPRTITTTTIIKRNSQ